MQHKSSNPADNLIMHFDQALKTLIPGSVSARRKNPAKDIPKTELDALATKKTASLMRINHTGEVCAQALYQGQALSARQPETREGMAAAAQEETDHLSWCEDRLRELNSHPSIFNPLWYSMSLGLGALAGLAGDRWSLGFVAETEHQVCKHLDEHLELLPEHDEKSRAILQQMRIDESRHAINAEEAGAAVLPVPVKKAMTLMSEVMKFASYRI